MDLVGELVARWTWDLFHRRDGYDVQPHRRRLELSQYLTPAELRALQLTRLQRLLSFTSENNAFYKERFDSCGVKPDDVRTLEDVGSLPILTKDDIRDHLSLHFSDGFDERACIRKRTGGSTGVPLHLYVDMRAMSEKKAATERHNSWAGRLPGQRLAMVWGDTTEPSMKLRLRNVLTERAVFLDTLEFNQTNIERFIGQLRRHRPPVLLGHAHSVFRLAEYMLVNDIRIDSITAAITSAMVLSPDERVTIEKAFACEVFNRYGCEELSIIASECAEHDGLHVFAEGLLVEVIGETEWVPGKLLITDLTNYAMPLIRYEIGDLARTLDGTCACGRTLPRLREISGRTADFLYRSDGTRVFGISILDTFVIHIPGIKQVQIIQDRLDHFDFYIVKSRDYSEPSLEILGQRVKDIFGDDVRHDVTFLDAIPQSPTGKYRFSICRIPDMP